MSDRPDTADYERLREHIRGAIKLLYPEEMTPHAKRMLERILDQNDEWVGARIDGGDHALGGRVMGDWVENMAPEERRNWEGFVDAVRKDAVGKIAQSAFVASLVPSGETDIKFAVELGLAIMLDKPVVAIAFPGRKVPPGLRRVAHSIIELEQDMDIEAGRLELQRKLSTVMKDLGMV